MKIFSLSLRKVEKDLWFFVFFPVVHLCLRKRYKFSPDALHEQFATKELFFSPPAPSIPHAAAKWKAFLSHWYVSTFTCSSLHTTNESGSVVKSLVREIYYWHFFIIHPPFVLYIEIYFDFKFKLNIKALRRWLVTHDKLHIEKTNIISLRLASHLS